MTNNTTTSSAGQPPLTADAARVLTDEVKADAAALWAKLLRLYEGGAHLALGYRSWSDYCAAEFDYGRTRSYQLLEAARVVDAVQHVGLTTPLTDRVARELVPVLRDDQEHLGEAWGQVVAEHGPRPTAEQTRNVVQLFRRTDRSEPEVEEPNNTIEDTVQEVTQKYAFVTEVRFHHDAMDQKSAERWAQRLVERTSRTGAICIYRNTRSV